MKVTSIISLFTLSLCLVPKQIVGSKDEPQLTLTVGTIKGRSIDFRGSKVYQFLGIPFAEPPLNELRFKKPVPKKPWTGTLQVNQWGPQCVQNLMKGLDFGFKVNEDCLTLNVFATQSAVEDGQSKVETDLRPVLVWIHGGGFNFGSANMPDLYDGTALSGLHDVVVVTVNYRLGPLGFLYAPEVGIPGNMGLWDQQLALQWVRDNIKNFGGDPNLVTIFGESAGSMSVSAHIVSPQSKGLFVNAIMQSGSIYDLDRWTIKDLIPKFIRGIGCNPEDDLLSCLRSYQPGQSKVPDDLMFWPISGDEFLPSHPETIVTNGGVDPNLNILLGTVGNEGAFMLLLKDPVTFHPINPLNLTIPHAKYILGKLFGKSLIGHYTDKYLADLSETDSNKIRLAVGQALGDTILTCPTYAFGQDLIKSGFGNLYVYYQSQRPSQSLIPMTAASNWLPPSHGDDIPMVFGHPLLFSEKFSIEDTILSFIMMDTWVTFARKGRPDPVGQQKWFPWKDKSYSTMVFDSRRIGSLESKPIEFCFKNWPYPLEEQYPLTIEPGAFSKIEGHDEL